MLVDKYMYGESNSVSLRILLVCPSIYKINTYRDINIAAQHIIGNIFQLISEVLQNSFQASVAISVNRYQFTALILPSSIETTQGY